MPKPRASAYESTVNQPGFPGREWMARYLSSMRQRTGNQKNRTPRASSKRAYGSVWRSYLVFLAGQGSDPVRADRSVALAFLQAHRNSATSLRYGRLLERVYHQAVAAGEVALNPFAKIETLHTQEEVRGDSAALTLHNVQEVLSSLPAASDWKEQRDQTAVVLAIGTGLRFRELRELRIEQFIEGSQGLEVQLLPRTAHAREIRLEPHVEQCVHAWLRTRHEQGIPGTHAFPREDGSLLPVNTLYRRVRKVLRELCGEHVLPHFGIGVLRAGFAQRARERDGVIHAQHALGHRRITSTLRLFKHLRPVNPQAK